MGKVFVMLSKRKVIFVINIQNFITSNIRHLQTKKIITLLLWHYKLRWSVNNSSYHTIYFLLLWHCCNGEQVLPPISNKLLTMTASFVDWVMSVTRPYIGADRSPVKLNDDMTNPIKNFSAPRLSR